MKLESSREMDEAFSTAITDRQSFVLAEVTPWEWDAVFIYGLGVKADYLDGKFGQSIIKDKRFQGTALFIFVQDGEPVRAVPSWSDWFMIPTNEEFSDSLLVGLQPSGPTALITFSES